MTEQTATVLFRPIGMAEYALLVRNGFQSWPLQLPHQPVFDPVTSEAYATRLARQWNARDAASGHVGYVTRFAVRSDFLARYPLRTVGGEDHEYWIPAEHLPELNQSLVGPIEVIAEFRPA
ncbi:MAG TPA: hypothetical protein VNA89_03755 [Gemmatimonadaceae bacterium]|nr:hypothetical protein [Gemmatimonadaceae bacterium]